MKQSTKQEVIKQNEKFIDFRDIISSSSIGYYTCNESGHITFYNAAAAHLWGRKPVIGKDFWCGSYNLYHPDGRPLKKENYPCAKALRSQIEYQKMELRMERPDGSFRQILLFMQLQYNDKMEITGTIGSFVDISDQAVEHLKNEVLSAIVESSDDAIISKDLNGIIKSWNRGAERLFGYSEKEAQGKHITMLIPKDRLKEEDVIISKIKSGKRIDHFETKRVDKSGREIPFSITVSPVKDTLGNVVGASKIARDISDRTQNEEKQAILSAIVESSDDAIISKNLDGNIMSWNNGAEKIFGYSEEEAIGKPITMLIPSERLEEENHILKKLRNGEKIEHFQTIRKHKSGRKIHISLTVSPIKKSSTGEIIGASKVARDITLQVQSQKALKKYAHNLEMLNSIGKSISENLDLKEILQRVTDISTRLTGAAFGAFFYNNSGEETKEGFRLFTISGAPMEAFEKMEMPRYTKMFEPTFIEKQIVRIEDVREHTAYGKNTPYNGMPKGHVPVVSYLAVPVVSKTGTVIGGLLYGHPERGVFTSDHELLVENIAAHAAVSLDNSELFERVKSLSDKKDEFIALASHELKTPLTTIKGYLQVLSKKKADKVTELFIGKALNQVEKLNTLIEDILNMSRIESGRLELNVETFDLKELLEDIVETFGYSTQTHKVKSELGNSPVLIRGDKQRLEQAIINLMTNAIKYSPGASAIYISLGNSTVEATVRVRDKGIGLTQNQIENLFTRFYRAENTKGINGLGLGLYLTKQIIDLHKGRIEVNSEYGKGSEFFFTIPTNQ